MTTRRGAPPTTVAAVACGGLLGALARYGVARALPTTAGHFPWSTFLVNVTGSALLGALLTVVVERLPRGHVLRPLLGTGVIGAYTTFSTFTVDAVLLVRHAQVGLAVLYVVSSLVAGLAAAVAGVAGTRATLRGRRAEAGGAP